MRRYPLSQYRRGVAMRMSVSGRPGTMSAPGDVAARGDSAADLWILVGELLGETAAPGDADDIDLAIA